MAGKQASSVFFSLLSRSATCFFSRPPLLPPHHSRKKRFSKSISLEDRWKFQCSRRKREGAGWLWRTCVRFNLEFNLNSLLTSRPKHQEGIPSPPITPPYTSLHCRPPFFVFFFWGVGGGGGGGRWRGWKRSLIVLPLPSGVNPSADTIEVFAAAKEKKTMPDFIGGLIPVSFTPRPLSFSPFPPLPLGGCAGGGGGVCGFNLSDMIKLHGRGAHRWTRVLNGILCQLSTVMTWLQIAIVSQLAHY